MGFTELFKPKETFMLIKESTNGIETYFNPDIAKLDDHTKALIRAFIDSIKGKLK